MNKGHLNNEQTTMETLGSSIVAFLLEERKVIIPELGYLELKVFPDKRTVLFKATENHPLFMVSEGSIQSLLYENISVPLKEGRVVNMPEIGIFRSMKNANGSYRVSYTISSALRKLLNDDGKMGEAGKPKIPEVPANADNESPQIAVKETTVCEENTETDIKKEAGSQTEDKDTGKEIAVSIPRDNIKTNQTSFSNVRNVSKVGDIVVPQDEKRNDEARMSKSIIAIAAIVVLIFISGYLLLGKNDDNQGSETSLTKDNEANDLAKSAKPIDLPFLAEKKYGNRIFWVYIYEANRDKISSPVNIPKGTVLRIPDLWEDYKVDVTDSMEIKRAGVLSDIMLKQKVQL